MQEGTLIQIIRQLRNLKKALHKVNVSQSPNKLLIMVRSVDMSIGRKFAVVIKGLIFSYALTGVLLAILAFLVFKFQLGESAADIAIVVIYVAVTFLGAFITGKNVKEQKFLWGFLLGFLYILIISILAIIIGQTFHVVSTANLTTAALCIGGGLLGGMLS